MIVKKIQFALFVTMLTLLFAAQPSAAQTYLDDDSDPYLDQLLENLVCTEEPEDVGGLAGLEDEGEDLFFGEPVKSGPVGTGWGKLCSLRGARDAIACQECCDKRLLQEACGYQKRNGRDINSDKSARRALYAAVRNCYAACVTGGVIAR